LHQNIGDFFDKKFNMTAERTMNSIIINDSRY